MIAGTMAVLPAAQAAPHAYHQQHITNHQVAYHANASQNPASVKVIDS